MKIGIDFGTSFSLPATTYLNQNVVLLPGGKYGIPSVFYYNQFDGILIGEEAERAGQGSDAQYLKREIKLALNSTFTADGKTFTAKEIVGHILSYIKENAIETAAKEKLINEPLEGVVISVPAAFEHNEKAFIKAAAALPPEQGGAGLKVLGFIKEPVAAALAYFNTSLADKTRVLVYDLGGGTFDVAVVEADSSLKEKYTVIDSDMLRLGGRDWDNRLEQFILHEVEKESGKSLGNNPGYMEKIKREAVLAKHAFSEKMGGSYRDRVRAKIEIDGMTYSVPISKAIFDELTLDLFSRTANLVKEVLERNGTSNIENIVCVGGSSKMPQVQEGLQRIFPHKKIQVYEPEKAIAFGAAIYAQYCDGKDTFLSDIAAFSYGTDCYRDYDQDPNDMIVVNLIEKGDRLPITKEHSFSTTRDNQQRMSFKIIENSHSEKKYPYNKNVDKPILNITLELPPNMPKGTSATLYLTLTADGMLEVLADDKKGNTKSASMQLLV